MLTFKVFILIGKRKDVRLKYVRPCVYLMVCRDTVNYQI